MFFEFLDLSNSHERQDFHEFITNFFKSQKELNTLDSSISSPDGIFEMKLHHKKFGYTDKYSIEVSSDNEKLFTFETTEYDKYEFSKTVKAGFLDNAIFELTVNDEFDELLGENEIYLSPKNDNLAYGVAIHIGEHKIINGKSITNILEKIDFATNLENIYYSNSDSMESYLDESVFNNEPTDPVVNNLIQKLDTVKKKKM